MILSLWDVIRAKALTCQSTQELIPQDVIRLLWESDEDNTNGHAAIFDVKFGKTLVRKSSQGSARVIC